MIKKIVSIVLIGTVLIGVFGCTKTPQINQSAIRSRSGADTYEPIDVDEAFRSASADFSIDLLKGVRKEGENTLVSPVSVMMALGMTGSGAANDTRSEFESVLGNGIDMDMLSRYYASYWNSLHNDESAKCHIANSIWIRNWEKLQIKENFLKHNETYYGAQVFLRDFDGDTLKDVNGWVNQNTDGMIKEIINANGISPDTMMMLINAVAFDAEWAKPYEKDDVEDVNFTDENGNVTKVRGMYDSLYSYLEDEDTVGFIKDYAEGYRFVVMLPKDENSDINEYIASFTGAKYMNLVNNEQTVKVNTMLPKFSYESSFKLNRTLNDMGIKDAFDMENADFSNIFEKNEVIENLYISDVLHKTYIEVAERGTRAGAATAVIVKDNGVALEETKKVICDRPFVYAIVDEVNMLPIFIGAYTTIE